MHSLAWGVPAFRPGIIMDVGGNYRWSHWGASGFCHMYPEMNVKPAFVAFATMSLVLDGAKFVRRRAVGQPLALRRGVRPARRLQSCSCSGRFAANGP